jgi:hypothetical protein
MATGSSSAAHEDERCICRPTAAVAKDDNSWPERDFPEELARCQLMCPAVLEEATLLAPRAWPAGFSFAFLSRWEA